MAEWKPKRKFVDPNRLTRKVFDKHVDRMELKRLRDREDHRADMKALLRRMENLESQLTQEIDQLQQQLGPNAYKESKLFQLPDGRWRRRVIEELE